MELESNLMNGYLEAYRIACECLKKENPEDIAKSTGANYGRINNSLILSFLNADYIINCSTGEITRFDVAGQITTTVKVLILHYLINTKIMPLSNKLISFKEIPGGGSIYYQTFQKRAILPLIKTFSNDFSGLFTASEKLGGTKGSYGHASVTLKVFPYVPVTYVVWQGDEEIADSGTILFDESITSFLPAEDIVLAASFGAYELIKQLAASG